MQSLRAAENESTSRRRTSVDKGKGSSKIIQTQGLIACNCLLYNYELTFSLAARLSS